TPRSANHCRTWPIPTTEIEAECSDVVQPRWNTQLAAPHFILPVGMSPAFAPVGALTIAPVGILPAAALLLLLPPVLAAVELPLVFLARLAAIAVLLSRRDSCAAARAAFTTRTAARWPFAATLGSDRRVE